MYELTEFGERLKNIRTERGLSLNDVSISTGVSKTMISQIERAESIPTLTTIWKIANGLKLSFASLLENPKNIYDVRKIEDIVPLKDDNGRIFIYSIFPFTPVTGFEMFYGVFKPGCNYKSKHVNSKTEYLMVAQGEIELTIGDKTYTIGTGSSISFDSNKTHIYKNIGDNDATIFFVIFYN